jgi:hypothetical protein
LAAGALLALTTIARAAARPDDPQVLVQTVSLGELIKRATRPVHIVYVHGMRADGAGASDEFRRGLCQRIPGLCQQGSGPTPSTEVFDLGSRPNLAFLGQPIWASDDDWKASSPFVLRYTYTGAGAHPVIVDEVNWWPLLFPAKCRFIVRPEIDLSGKDVDHLKLCARNDGHYHPWITQDELARALEHKPVSGGGAWVNAYLKQQIMNWGMADAVLTLGPLRTYFRRAMNLAFDHAARFQQLDVEGQDFVVISESLGSFVVLDAFGNRFDDSREAQRVGERTADLYFFANQFALLHLGRLDPPRGPSTAAPAEHTPVPREVAPQAPQISLLEQWISSRPQGAEQVVRTKQIIAFSDPSDLLTYPVPKLEGALVVNVYDRNEWSFLRLYANPLKAHTRHPSNSDVLDVMFRGAPQF